MSNARVKLTGLVDLRHHDLQSRTLSVWLANIVAYAAFFGGGIFLVLELPWIENTFRSALLSFSAVGVGLALYAVMRRAVLNRLFLSLGHSAWAAHLLVAVGSAAIFPATASWLNRQTANSLPVIESYMLVAKEHAEPRPRTAERWILLINARGRREKVIVTRLTWERVTAGETVELPVTKGRLGFMFVDDQF